MRSLKFLIFVAIILQLIFKLNAACVCGEKGTDYCAGCNEQRIVRPQPKYYNSNPELELPPIGDNCWCSKLMIEPAALPKPLPCPKHKTPTCGCKNPPAPYYGDSYSVPYAPAVSYVPSKPQDDSLPADPISVSLAIQAGKAIEVPEAKLAYGFVQKPLDGLKKIYFSNVPEENLFKLKNEVITLKKPKPAPKEEEEYEPEEEEESPADDDVPPHLTYKQLGYGPEQFKNPKFRKVSTSYAAYAMPDDEYASAYKPSYSKTSEYKSDYSSGYKSDYNTEYKSDYKKVTVDCGYKPGKISPYRKINTRADVQDCFEDA